MFASIWTISLSFTLIIDYDILVIHFRGGFYLKSQPYKPNESDREVCQKEDFAPKLIERYNMIYVGNLPWDITEDDIKKLFSDCKIS
jgi:RNA recognition motif-containing protein